MRSNATLVFPLVMLSVAILIATSSGPKTPPEASNKARVQMAANPPEALKPTGWLKTDRAPADPKTYLKPLAEQLNKTWPKNRTINIVCHGHSVPAGYFKTPRVDTLNSYPHLLHVGLNKRYPNAVINVITTAIGGEASPSGAKRFEQDVLPHRPDLILIDYALNDRGVGVERAEAAWREMIEQALEQKIPVVLLTPTAALKAKMDDPKDPINQHADLVRSLAKEYGVALADSTNAFKQFVANGASYQTLMSHPVHPNRLGHELVAEQLLAWFPE